jgi:hypothetical protein
MTSRDSIVCIEISYGLEGPGFEFRWAKRFPLLYTDPDRPWSPHSLLCNAYRSCFPGVKRPGGGVDNTPPSGAEVKRKYSYTFTSLLVNLHVTERPLPLPYHGKSSKKE